MTKNRKKQIKKYLRERQNFVDKLNDQTYDPHDFYEDMISNIQELIMLVEELLEDSNG